VNDPSAWIAVVVATRAHPEMRHRTAIAVQRKANLICTESTNPGRSE
jgi:hypothetical protein